MTTLVQNSELSFLGTATKAQMIPSNFGDLAVHVGGNAHGPVMVFWPSLLLDSSMWSHQCEHFEPNYRIVLIGPPGIDKSAPLRRVISVEGSAACLRRILDALKIETSSRGRDQYDLWTP